MSTQHREIAATSWRPTEGTRANFLAKAVLATNTEVNAISARDLLVGHLVGLGDRTVGKTRSGVGALERRTRSANGRAGASRPG